MVAVRLMTVVVCLSLAAPQSSGIVILGPDLHDGYYGEEPPFSVDDAPWLGLVAEAGTSALRPVDLEWSKAEVAPGAEPRYRLAADLARPLFLVSKIDGLRPGPVEAATPPSSELSEGAPRAEVELRGRQYVWSLESPDPNECTAVVTLSDGVNSQRIEVEGVLGCGDPHFAIHWAGDLDSDGALDFLATFSMKYSYHPRQLYLS